MALQTFARALVSGATIKVFNHGNHMRDFTFIDDIVGGLISVVNSETKHEKEDKISQNWKIYNIGNSNPVNLIDYISQLESCFGVVANKDYLPMQPGDMKDTYADVSDLERDLNYKPSTSVEDGVSKFVDWYKDYYKIKL
jgi:UDP-glucuronate 4-epimerase